MQIVITDHLQNRSYSINPTENGDYFISNEYGEGMSLSEKNLFDILDEYFKREF